MKEMIRDDESITLKDGDDDEVLLTLTTRTSMATTTTMESSSPDNTATTAASTAICTLDTTDVSASSGQITKSSNTHPQQQQQQQYYFSSSTPHQQQQHQHHHHHQQHHQVINPPHRVAVVTLTEAQLRWAQFHHKRRALIVREQIERLYQTPASEKDVEGAVSDDGNSSTTTTSSGCRSPDNTNNNPDDKKGNKSRLSRSLRRRRRVPVSRGRRALLRVSKRRHAQRKAHILQHGFQRYNNIDQSEEDEEDEDHDDFLAAIFAEESWRKRRQKQRRRRRRRQAGECDNNNYNNEDGDLDRIQRFEQAFHAMMMTLAAAQQKQQSQVVTATRIWKRSAEVQPADLDFTQWQLPTSHNKHHQHHYSTVQQSTSTRILEADAKATSIVLDPHRSGVWIPPDENSKNNSNHNEPTLQTPHKDALLQWNQQQQQHNPNSRLSYRELVELLQQQVDDRPLHDHHHHPYHHHPTRSSSPPPSPPRMRLVDKFFQHSSLSFDEKKEQDDTQDDDSYQELERLASSLLPDLFLRHDPSFSPFAVADNTYNNSLDLIQEMEQAEPGISKKIFTLYLQDHAATPYTARQQLLSAARRHLELYALNYLSSSSSLSSSQQKKKQEEETGGSNSSSMVRELVERLEHALFREGENNSRIWQDGKLHKPAFARLVRDYLLQARRRESLSFQRSRQQQQRARVKVSSGDLSFLVQDEAEQDEDNDVDDCDDDNDDPFARVLQEQQERDNDKEEEWDFVDEADALLVESLLEQVLLSEEEELVDTRGHITDVFKDMVARYLEQATLKKKRDSSGRHEAADLVVAVEEDIQDQDSCWQQEAEEQMQKTPAADASVSTHPDAIIIKLFAQEFVEQLLRTNKTVEPVFTAIISTATTTKTREEQEEVRLVKPALEKFAVRYIQQSAETPKNQNADDFFLGFRSPEALARARQQSARKQPSQHSHYHHPQQQQHSSRSSSKGSVCPPALESPVTTRKFIRILQTKMEREISMHAQKTTAPTGPLSAAVLEELVEQSLLEAVVTTGTTTATATTNLAHSQQEQHDMLQQRTPVDAGSRATTPPQEPLFDDLEDFVQPFLAHLEHHILNGAAGSPRRGGSSRLEEDLVRQVVDLCLPPSVRSCAGVFVDCFVDSFMDSFRKSFDGILDSAVLQDIVQACAEDAASEYVSASASADTASTTLVADTNDAAKRIISGSMLDTTSMASKLADTVSGKVGGLLGLKWSHQPGKQDNNEEELQAVAAFRMSRQQRHGTDDTSSLSSFRVPEGIRKVVQSLRRAGHMMGDPEVEEEASKHSSLMQLQSVGSHGDYSHSSSVPSSRDESDFSPERVRKMHRKVMEKSALFGDGDANRSIIDTDGSEVSYLAMDPAILSNLMLSPTILTKRLQQAIRAVETRSWKEVIYLLQANPWLAEMTDLKTNQFLLHKVALYGSSSHHEYSPPPEELNTDLIRMFPSAVHKLDHDGNLPLHMAAASANLSMIRLLGDRFPSGASVRNEDGMLPLHLVILAMASQHTNVDTATDKSTPSELVKTMLEYFPGAVAIADNEGNLPLHAATSALKNDVGVNVVLILQDEADRQVTSGARFRNKVRIKETDTESVVTETADSNEEIFCNLVRNERGETPLMVAIHSRAGWKLIEALVAGPGGAEAVLCQDSELNNSLHMLVNDHYRDPKAVMSILKVAPEAARLKNLSNMIPFEIACRQEDVPHEVLLAIVLIDLPFDLDDTECQNRDREGCGASWFFLTCECDDAYVDVVEEVVSLCSYPQARELCFFDVGSGETLLARATLKCRSVLQRSLRFLGRFEFVSAQSEETTAYRLFDAIDFGRKEDPTAEGRRVVLKCYLEQDLFERETYLLRQRDLDFSLLEEVRMFAVGEDGLPTTTSMIAKQFCVSIEQPDLTLEGVVAGMLANDDCQAIPAIRQRYAEKAFTVLRVVAKALRHLHSLGLVHGSLSLRNCAKYQNRWKLCNVLGIHEAGQAWDHVSMQCCIPPELRHSIENGVVPVTRVKSGRIQPPVDVWAFGNLAYEVLVGKRMEAWDRHDMSDLHRALVHDACVPSDWAEFILSCLAPDPETRPTMADSLRYPFWKDNSRHSGIDE